VAIHSNEPESFDHWRGSYCAIWPCAYTDEYKTGREIKRKKTMITQYGKLIGGASFTFDGGGVNLDISALNSRNKYVFRVVICSGYNAYVAGTISGQGVPSSFKYDGSAGLGDLISVYGVVEYWYTTITAINVAATIIDGALNDIPSSLRLEWYEI